MTTQRPGPGRFTEAPDPGRFIKDAPPERRSTPMAILAALALLLLLIGVPVALITLTGPPPFPHGWPSREDLTAPIGIDAVLTVLRGVVWLAWLHFSSCVVAEFASAVRGRGVPRSIPLGGGSQRLARVLVGALLLTGIAAGQAAAVTGAVGGPIEPKSSVSISATTQVEKQAADEHIDVKQFTPQSTASTASKDPLAGKKVYVVKAPHGHHHDSLWDIADKHLGDGRRYKEIYELNKERTQPDGQHLHLARLIQPGWTLIMPEDASGVERQPTEHVQAPPKQTTDTHHAATPKPTTNTPDIHQAGGGGGGGDGAGDVHQSPTGGGEHQPGDQGQQQDSRWRLPNDLLGGGLVAAGLLALLLTERYRRRGRDPEPAATAAEVALRVGADPARAEALDRALRGLVGQCDAVGVPLPPLFAAAVDDYAIELLLAPPRMDAPAPWQALDDGRRWRLERSDIAADAAGPAPYPALVCLGRDYHERDVLVDLEAAGGALSVRGDSVVAREVATSVAVQLATNPWGDQLRVTTSGLPDSVGEVLEGRLRVVPDIDMVLPDFEQGGMESEVLSGRVTRSSDASPQYVVLGAPPDDDTARRLAVLAAQPRAGFGLMVAGDVTGARWQLQVDESGTLLIPSLDLVLSASRLTEPTVELVTELLAAARTSTQLPSGGSRVRIPPTGSTGDDSNWVTASVRVGVLGTVEVRSPYAFEAERLPLATEIVTFVALHPGGVHPSVLAASVWPRGVTSDVRDATVERVRQWLGTDSQGGHHLRQDVNGRLYLGPEVAVDWDCFCELVRRSRSAQTLRDERELLRRSLHLVRGPFLSGRPRGGYSWIARVHLERVVPDLVVDTAHRLSQLTLGDDDPAGAVSAARAGLRLASNSDLMWQDLLRAEYRYGGVAAAEKVVEALGEGVLKHNLVLSPETEALIDELLPTGASRARRVS
ncbi:LysM peptidoglycan-binding domain-containing protein [Kribbella sp. NBC_01505]|uniref:BTAD domain-containing putative transcriptional regulator n=1 Tax=Kribbella sp. NBC_01505 TaxID=2903580 RepID=UPI003864E912